MTMDATLQQLQLIELWVKILGGIVTLFLAILTFLIRHFYKRLKPWFLALFANADRAKHKAEDAASSSALAATRTAENGKELEAAQRKITALEEQSATADRRLESATDAMDRMASRHDSLLAAFLRQEATNRRTQVLEEQMRVIANYLGQHEAEYARQPRTGSHSQQPDQENPHADDE